ncbi:SOS response-associated peptidase [Natranaerofaba carboxydovora]|uniref:SOS response-associated peptidase n=1 Tax=Natranaerofaba carboxydovora TaxID=2742683 RepID=UPI001F13917C|nr:SOS response-associated peptidase [Natranaerofaba carboxydovora]UMZ73776.1 Putative SOS response-associated peptidase YedK [Natranaerofaba carboxydovora]
MCGRYFLSKSFRELLNRYDIDEGNNHYDLTSLTDESFGGEIFPSQDAPVVLTKDSKKLVQMKWGFAPSFTNKLLINARGETVDQKPTFKKSILKHRCLIPAEAFFEWEKQADNKKLKRKIFVPDQEIFSLAGIYDKFHDKEGNEYFAYSILTVEANNEIKDIHHRMPVILAREEEDKWLEPLNNNITALKQIIRPYEQKLSII